MDWGWVDKKDFGEYRQSVEAKLAAAEMRVQALDQALKEKTPELLEDVKAAAESAVADADRIRTIGDGAATVLSDLVKDQESVQQQIAALKVELEALQGANQELKTSVDANKKVAAELGAAKATATDAAMEIVAIAEAVKANAKVAETMPGYIKAAEDLVAQCTSSRDNAKGIVDDALERRKKVDEAANEILGQDIKSEGGQIEHIDGVRDKLRKSFDGVEGALKDLVDRGTNSVNAVTQELSALMPGAMAAGLSAAYEEKAKDEKVTQGALEKTFKNAIGGLVLISLVPFFVAVYLLASGHQLLDVIHQMPVLPIIPLYLPVLWLAVSVSKKVNLSKRLVEEYIHKAVLGKTFSGLAEQIEKLTQGSEVKEELRLRLLYNVLQVSAENPGKLMKDYQGSDHPLIEVLDRSSKLKDALEGVERIPGLRVLAEKLIRRDTARLAAQEDKVIEAIEVATKPA